MNDTRDRILAFVVQYIKERGFPPAVRDIMSGASISSTSVVSYNLKKLAEAGRISMTPGITRSIVVVDTTPKLAFCDSGKHDIVTPWVMEPQSREYYPALSATHCRKCGVSWPDAGKGPRGDHKLGSPYWPAVPVADEGAAHGRVEVVPL